MKKDRDCNAGMTPYPIYPAYMPGMAMPMMNPNMMGNPAMMAQPNLGMAGRANNYSQGSSTIEQQLYNLNNQISSLERRVSSLEALVGNTSTQYNTSNYQVM